MFSGRLPLPQVSDAVRVAFLSKYGGVWLDVDTIILNPDAEKYFLPDPKNRTVLFGGVKSRCSHLAYINTPPATISICIKDWYEHVKKSLQSLKSSTKFTWSFLGNDFINNYAQKHINEVEILSDTLVMPARRISPGKAFKDIYVDYFFLQNLNLKDINAHMLMLTNTKTPPFFKRLTREELLRCDCTMTNILAEILEIELPQERISYKDMVKK